MLTTAWDHGVQQLNRHARIEKAQDFIDLAQGLNGREKQRFLALLIDSSSLRRAIKDAVTHSEFSAALQLIRDSFESPEHISQINAWATSLEAEVMRKQGTDGERIVYDTQNRQHREMMSLQRQTLAEIQRFHTQADATRDDPLRLLSQIRSLHHPDLAGFRMDYQTGGMELEFRPGVHIAQIRVTGNAKAAFIALENGEANLRFTSDDPEVEIVDLHPILRDRFGESSKTGSYIFEIRHVPQIQSDVQHFGVGEQRFSLACIVTRPVPRGEVLIEFGVNRSVSLSIQLLPQGDRVQVQVDVNVGVDDDVHYDSKDLDLVRFLHAAVNATEFHWYATQSDQHGLKLPISFSEVSLKASLYFIEIYIEANRFLLKQGVLERPFPWPDQDDNFERISRELQQVVIVARAGEGAAGGIKVSFEVGAEIGEGHSGLRPGLTKDAMFAVSLGQSIRGRVWFARIVELHAARVRFLPVNKKWGAITLGETIRRLGRAPTIEVHSKASHTTFSKPPADWLDTRLDLGSMLQK